MADTWGKVEKNKYKDTNKDSDELKRLTKGFNKVWKKWNRKKMNIPKTWD